MEIIVYAFFAAIPSYYLWNDLAPTYLYQLPEVYLHLPFWNVVEIFILVALIRFIIFPTPIIMNKNIWKSKN